MVQFMLSRLTVVFYRSESGREPARDWLLALGKEDRRVIGEELATVQFGWPVGMPLVRYLDGGIWELRVRLNAGPGRLLFLCRDETVVLLHGFVKKTRKTPRQELATAQWRASQVTTGGVH